MLNNTQKWVLTLVITGCFILVSSPLVFSMLGSMGVQVADTKGCTSWVGVLVQTVLFLIIGWVLVALLVPKKETRTETYSPEMQAVINKEYPEYKGLVSPADMLRCNGAQLEAEDANSPECYDAARACMSNPFSQKCVEKINTCMSTCSNEYVSKAVATQCGFGFRQ